MLTQSRFTTKMEKLLAFYDSDITGHKSSFLEQASSDGFALLPLNTSAMALCSRSKAPFSLLDKWISPQAIVKARARAAKWERCWFGPAAERLSSNNICWPSFDREAMYWFWRDVAVGYAFAESFLANGGQELCYFTKRPPRPSLYYYRSDVVGALWKSILSSKARPIEILSKDSGTSECGYLSPSTIAFVDQGGSPSGLCSDLTGKIVLALNPGEVHRFEPAIRQLADTFPGNVAVVMLFPNLKEAQRLSLTHSIPILSPVSAVSRNSLLQDRFSSGYQELLALTGEQQLQWTMTCLKHHFEYYCGKRWPALATNFQSWLDLWSRHPPRAVIISSLEDAESQLPAEAARRHNIPTFSIPHGGSMTRTRELNVADYILFQFPFHEKIHNKGPLAARRMRPCSNLLSVNEYPVNHDRAARNRLSWSVLALLNPVGRPECICPYLMVGTQMDALRILDQPPPDIADQLELKVKVHPGIPDLGLFDFTSPRLANKVLPPASGLQTALAEAELIVAVNYSGIALAHSLRSGKPIIFFWNDPLLKSGIPPHEHAHFFLPAGCSVDSPDELWSTIRKFFTEEGFAEELRSRAREFARRHLSDANHPAISEVIREALSASPPEGLKELSMNSLSLEKRKFDKLIPNASSVPFTLIDYRFDYGEMLLDELIALCRLARHKDPRVIFEIGTFMGGTTLQLAANSKATILTLDLPPSGHAGHVTPAIKDSELDVYPDEPGGKCRIPPYSTRIRQLYGDSRHFNFAPYHGIVDMVFVDGSHHYENVCEDSLNALKMIKPDGMVIWHDYAEYASGVVRALNELAGMIRLVHIEGTSLVLFSQRTSQERAPSSPPTGHRA